MNGHAFTDPVSGAACVVHFGDTPGVEHPDCLFRAEVYPDLDSFFCRRCQWNGRVSGAWFMELLAVES